MHRAGLRRFLQPSALRVVPCAPGQPQNRGGDAEVCPGAWLPPGGHASLHSPLPGLLAPSPRRTLADPRGGAVGPWSVEAQSCGVLVSSAARPPGVLLSRTTAPPYPLDPLRPYRKGWPPPWGQDPPGWESPAPARLCPGCLLEIYLCFVFSSWLVYCLFPPLPSPPKREPWQWGARYHPERSGTGESEINSFV